jgi:eukaryotic-like serine/threonine-protein kinase
MLARLGTDRWRVVIPYLDRALDLRAEERAPWLAALRAEDPALADELKTLLERHDALEEQGYLASPPLPPTPQATLAGQAIGAYTLRSQIGQGGMGSVWLAERSDGRFRGQAAVKLLNASLVGRDGEARFRREGSILARLRHPHIAHLIDAGVSPLGQPYLVLERVDGQRIDRYCDARSLGIEARIVLFLDVLTAVAHAHANLVVHRDLKPSNVLVATDGQVKLLDFGIAKLLESDTDATHTALTRDGESVLTPEYAAPEQLTAGTVTTATDVYSLGVLLYVLLAGRHPAGGDRSSPARLIHAIVDTEPVRVSDAVTLARHGDEGPAEIAARRATTTRRLRGALQGDLDNIVAKALKKRPQERYPSAEALADDLRRYLDDRPVRARGDSVTYRAAKFVRRNRMAVASGTLAGLALAVGLLGTLSQARRATRQAALAETQRARADQEARVAGEQRDFALRQLSRAEALRELNVFLLGDAAPSGKPLNTGDLLARAESLVFRQASGDDNQVDMLIEIGILYGQRDERAKALRVLREAYELARKVTEPSLRAKAACALGIALSRDDKDDDAARMVQEGQAALPRQPQYAPQRIVCLLSGSQVARSQGDAKAAIERAQQAQGLLKESSVGSPILELEVWAELASSYGTAGRHREAIAAHQEALRRLTALGRDETERTAIVLHSWARSLQALGRPLEAERHLRQAVRLLSVDGSDGRVSPVLLLSYAQVLRDVDQLGEASRVAERGFARSQQVGGEDLVSRALLLRASIYRQLGQLGRAAAMLAALEPRLLRIRPPSRARLASLASEQALLAQARADFRHALPAADRAISLSEAGARESTALAQQLLRRADLKLAMHRPDEALADATRALAIVRAPTEPGAHSSWQGLAYLELSRALQAQGRKEDAQAAIASALQHLEPALGAEHPTTRRARKLALRED